MEDTYGITDIEGKWYDANGDTTLLIEGCTLKLAYGQSTDEYDSYNIKRVTENNVEYIENDDVYPGFMIMSRLCIEDGQLTAHDEILDGYSHRYRFLREEAFNEAKQIVDMSKDLPKSISSDVIEKFSLYLSPGYSFTPELEGGNFSWNVTRGFGGYRMTLSVIGSSYVIASYDGTVSRKYVKELDRLIKESGACAVNGYKVYNDVDGKSYSMEVTYNTKEKIWISSHGDAAKTTVIDFSALVKHAFSVI